MKHFVKLFFLSLFLITAGHAKAAVHKGNGNNSDSTASLKSNILIFKVITSPATGTTNGSLKQAGKVARTSNTHSSTKSAPLTYNEG
jgi:hypothetical protein